MAKKAITPQSLYHYTSFETVSYILCKEALENRLLSFHFSNPLQTNDQNEVHFFQEHVFGTKAGGILEEKMDKLKGIIGDPFTLSLIHHEGKGYPSCEIPMWKMYGNNFQGVRLRFNGKKLEDFCKSNEIDLIDCQYMKVTEMKEKGRKIRNYSDEQLSAIYKDAIRYKTYDWKYENEWRLVKWCNKIELKEFNGITGRIYINVMLPLDCLEIVEIGPKADQTAFEASLFLLKEKYNAPFKVQCSNLKIGYV